MRDNPMRLTLINRLRLCWEILTARSGHGHPASEKQLSTFTLGYGCGFSDGMVNGQYILNNPHPGDILQPFNTEPTPPINRSEEFCEECGGFVIGVHPDDWDESQQCSCKGKSK